MERDYETVTEAVNDLKARGYTANLMLDTDKEYLVCDASFTELSPEQFSIDEVYRFEGMTDPGDEMIVYAISSNDNTIKGIVVNAYGIYASHRSNRLVDHLSKHG